MRAVNNTLWEIILRESALTVTNNWGALVLLHLSFIHIVSSIYFTDSHLHLEHTRKKVLKNRKTRPIIILYRLLCLSWT